jgi:hypothetical protein
VLFFSFFSLLFFLSNKSSSLSAFVLVSWPELVSVSFILQFKLAVRRHLKLCLLHLSKVRSYVCSPCPHGSVMAPIWYQSNKGVPTLGARTIRILGRMVREGVRSSPFSQEPRSERELRVLQNRHATRTSPDSVESSRD